MKIIIAMDAFKGSITSHEANNAVEEGILNVYPDASIIKIPIADGGEGTLDSFITLTNGRLKTISVSDPLGRKIKASYGILPHQTAIIEMAQASGLPLLTDAERNPLVTTTYGVGELIIDAIKEGCQHIILGLGGSATNDAGLGMLEALGYQIFDQNKQLLKGNGEALNKLVTIDETNRHPRLKDIKWTVLCDVDNPFYGELGASYVYAKQKGANKPMIELLDQGLRHFADYIVKTKNIDLNTIKGSGAAGGLGGTMVAFFNAHLKSGIDTILDLIQFDSIIKEVDYIITGEGSIDQQSAQGKVVQGIGRRALPYGVPVIALGGSLLEGAETLYDHGVISLFSIMRKPMSLSEAMDKQGTYRRLTQLTQNLSQMIQSILNQKR